VPHHPSSFNLFLGSVSFFGFAGHHFKNYNTNQIIDP